jgi:ketosteroid isomerase-like protein
MRLPAAILATVIGAMAASPSTRCDPPTAADAIAQVRALNQQYIDAARAGDATLFARHMAGDVVVILGGGTRLRKPEFLAAVGGDTRAFTSLTVRDVTVRVFGGTVQVDADAPWERADGRRGVSRYIDTWAWLGCRWQVISAQITLLPEPDAR